jgi:predicted SAM-dependent methyltransferase
MPEVKLNLGAGDVPLEGYIAIDRKTGGEVFPVTDTNGPGLYADGTVDEIRASHVLEHFGHEQTLAVLKEWVRVLKPGGILKIAVPDFDKIVNWYVNGAGSQGVPLEQYLFGGHVDDNDRHGAMFNAQKLTQLMHMAGLGEVHPWKSELQDCAALPVSLNLVGIKGAGKYPSLVGKVAACFSIPRLAFSDNMFCAQRAFVALQIPAIRKSGVFWGHALQGAMEMQLATGAKYLLTVDYDTIFTTDDVLALYRLMEAHPEADAICPVQSGRDRATPLMTVADESGKAKAMLSPEEVAADLLELRTGHFGLTLIRSESLKKFPKPWFMHKPDEKGEWGDGRIDDDIYFWIEGGKHGLRLFQANRVTVGHAQLVVSWPGQSMETIHQYASEYEYEGKPEIAWR